MLEFQDMTLTQGAFSLQVQGAVPSGVTAIVGPSGGGKSTLLAAVAGFLAPTAGRMMWGDAPLRAAPGQRPVAMMFQDNNLFPHLTLEQNVGLGLRADLRLRPQDRSQITEALAQVGLAGMGTRRPAELSGGQQSRAGLARVLLSGQPIVLLDEPFGALGPALRRDMLALTTARLAGRTVLMVTHDPQDAAVCDHLMLIAEGRAQMLGSASDALRAPPEALRSYLGEA